MQRILALLILILLVWACQSPKSQEDSQADTTTELTESEEAPDAKPTMESHDGYSVKVLNGEKASPRKEMTATIHGVDVTVEYSSPAVKGRTIWGELVPYDEVWRTGADEATKITLSQDVNIAGQPTPAGTYAFFTIPGENDWTLILNSEADQFGAFSYKEDTDVIRAKVESQVSADAAERMDFIVQDGVLMLVWDKLMVPVPIGE